MKKNRAIIFMTVICFIFFLDITPATIGSDSAIQRFDTQQVLYNGDRVAFFAALNDGFEIYSSDSSATFDSIFPVGGQVKMTLGTLTLLQDLLFADDSDWFCISNIVGNNHTIRISPHVTSFPSGATEAQEPYLITSINDIAAIKTVQWSYDNKFVAVGLYNSGGVYDTLKIYEFNGTSLTFKSSQSFNNKTVHDVSWHPSSYMLAIGITDDDYDLFVYEVNGTTGALTLKGQAYLTGTGYAVDWHPAGSWLAVGSDKSSQEVRVFAVDGTGVINGNPVAYYDADATPSTRATRWEKNGNYLAVGLNSAAANELMIFKFDQGTQALTVDTVKNIEYTVNALSWNKVHADYLAVGLTGSSERLRIYKYDSVQKTLTQVASTNLSISVSALEWGKSGSCLYVGRVNSSQEEFITYSFDTATDTLRKINGFHFASQVNAISCSSNDNYVVLGADTWALNVYSSYEIGCPMSNVTFQNLTLALQADTVIQKSNIVFSGDCTIAGNGNTVTLSPSCNLIVGSSSTLRLHDIEMAGIQSNNISCLDSTGTIQLDNATWILQDNYNFAAGKLDIINNCKILGQNKTCNYQTSAASTIGSNASLLLGNNLTFYYDPPTANNQLISLTDTTSKIILNGATLKASADGLQLTKGTLEFLKKSYFYSEGTSAGQAIQFGDGVSSANNVTLKSRPGVGFEILNGYVIDNNV